MPDQFVTVATFASLPEAEAARLLLETEGVSTILVDAEIVSMDWLLGTAVGYIKLQVPAVQAEAATRRIEQVAEERRRRIDEASGDETDDWSGPDDLACLSCGEEMPEEETRCPSCGWSYAEGRE